VLFAWAKFARKICPQNLPTKFARKIEFLPAKLPMTVDMASLGKTTMEERILDINTGKQLS
jgi:hypothetical protein